MICWLARFHESEKLWKNFCVVVFWGSFWGIVEATFGYLMHRMDIRVGWCIWFPLAFYFLNKIYEKTGEVWCVLYGGLVAALIKFTDIFVEQSFVKVVNPSASIIFEAASLLILYKIMEKRDKKVGIFGIAWINVVWRALFLTYIFLFMPKVVIAKSQLRALSPFLKFMLLESAVNTVIIEAYLLVRERFLNKDKTLQLSKFMGTIMPRRLHFGTNKFQVSGWFIFKHIDEEKFSLSIKFVLSIVMLLFAIVVNRFI